MNAPLDTEGPAAPPRSNGELLFAEPWESRACGMAEDAGLTTAVQIAQAQVNKAGDTLGTIKARMCAPVPAARRGLHQPARPTWAAGGEHRGPDAKQRPVR
ncbi:hypothetical protein ACFYZB_42375 [Streptomyces sp. NPDC001852]|uniref:hypothetical protein n=1 Tax=Streptomyces sp. NPDC001852 TaxID=3364619 RepID=UPI00368DF833